ncbi:hypothetical protein [Methylobacillus sp.]|uniref:hypothetical protein n=1 Tax=Methylobacillus sp. TaxID=56818 RepID=UPI002FE363F1
MVMVLALLQALLPLLHAHPASAPSSDTGSGIHMHELMTDHLSHPWTTPSLETEHDHVQVISVGIAHEPESIHLPVLVGFATFLLVALFFGRSAHPITWREHDFQLVPAADFFISPLRAPPQS